MNEEILKAVDEIADEMIEGIKRIVRIDSVESEAVNDAPFGEGVRHALDETLQLSRDLGFETVDVDHYIGYARYGKSDDYVCACGHLDVVPVGEGWKHPPFSAYEEDGVIYSRGILDNKGPILSCLYALTALKRLGIKPEREVRIIFGCDEESGFEDLKYYLDHEKAPIAGFTPDCKYPVVYAERGRAVIKVKADLDHLITFMNKYILNTQNKGERLGIDYKNDEFGQLEIRNYHLTKEDFSFSISYPAGITLEEILDKLNRIEGYKYEVVSHFKPVYFDKNGFIEIETPMLIKSTPEGARDYLVPSRVFPGNFFALPQSPQLYKQLLMLSGFDRYFQVARCFRDEDLRADRQPEFTQIDLEMSFVNSDDVMAVTEGFIKKVFKEVLNKDVLLPLKRLTYNEAMTRFGSDKPDLRFGMELVNLTELLKNSEFKVFSSAIAAGGSVCAINARKIASKLPRKEIDKLIEWIKAYGEKGLAWTKINLDGTSSSSYEKFLSESEILAIRNAVNAQNDDVILLWQAMKSRLLLRVWERFVAKLQENSI